MGKLLNAMKKISNRQSITINYSMNTDGIMGILRHNVYATRMPHCHRRPRYSRAATAAAASA